MTEEEYQKIESDAWGHKMKMSEWGRAALLGSPAQAVQRVSVAGEGHFKINDIGVTPRVRADYEVVPNHEQ